MNSNPTIVRARELRKTPNEAEQYLWNAVKSKQLAGYKFTRQFPIGPYFADFACRRELLLVELDGSQHVDNAYDHGRDAFLNEQGYSVLRFFAGSVLRDRDSTCFAILAALENKLDDVVDSIEMKFRKSRHVPLKFRRHRPWDES